MVAESFLRTRYSTKRGFSTQSERTGGHTGEQQRLQGNVIRGERGAEGREVVQVLFNEPRDSRRWLWYIQVASGEGGRAVAQLLLVVRLGLVDGVEDRDRVGVVGVGDEAQGRGLQDALSDQRRRARHTLLVSIEEL